MKFNVVFRYMDGEDFEVEVHPDDIPSFMACLGKNEVYFNPSKGVGVWIPIDKIRYFQLEKLDEEGNRIVVERTQVNTPAEAENTPEPDKKPEVPAAHPEALYE